VKVADEMNSLDRVPAAAGASSDRTYRSRAGIAKAYRLLAPVLAAAVSVSLAGCAVNPAPTVPPALPSPGHIELNQTSLSNSGGGGTGTVYLGGKAHRFTIAGLGVGGDAIAVLQTTGQTYRLDDLPRFPGTYRQAPPGIIPAQGTGGLWLQNAQGVVLHLLAPAGGRIPPIGQDAVLIETLD